MEVNECYGKEKPFYSLLLILEIQWQVTAAHFLNASICVTVDYKANDLVCSTEDKWLERLSITFTYTVGVF